MNPKPPPPPPPPLWRCCVSVEGYQNEVPSCVTNLQQRRRGGSDKHLLPAAAGATVTHAHICAQKHPRTQSEEYMVKLSYMHTEKKRKSFPHRARVRLGVLEGLKHSWVQWWRDWVPSTYRLTVFSAEGLKHVSTTLHGGDFYANTQCISSLCGQKYVDTAGLRLHFMVWAIGSN